MKNICKLAKKCAGVRLLRKPDHLPRRWRTLLEERDYTCVRGVEYRGQRQLCNFLAWSPDARGAMRTRCGFRSDGRHTETLADFNPMELDDLETVDQEIEAEFVKQCGC